MKITKNKSNTHTSSCEINDDSMPENKMIKCINYELCEGNGIPDFNNLCMACSPNFVFGLRWGSLSFFDCDEECAVCYNNCKRKLLFPTDCGHSFCVNCSKEILLWDETRYHLSPVPFGCSDCPNGCINPVQGKQCYCEKQSLLENEWEKTNPMEYKLWNDSETESIIQGDNGLSSFGSRSCPLCRSKYEIKEHISNNTIAAYSSAMYSSDAHSSELK